MAQTAVEWLEEQLNKWSDGRFYLPSHLFEQAKQMEKEQIVDAYKNGCLDSNTDGSNFYFRSKQYYNETYNAQ